MEELSWRVGMGPDKKGRKYRRYPVDGGKALAILNQEGKKVK